MGVDRILYFSPKLKKKIYVHNDVRGVMTRIFYLAKKNKSYKNGDSSTTNLSPLSETLSLPTEIPSELENGCFFRLFLLFC